MLCKYSNILVRDEPIDSRPFPTATEHDLTRYTDYPGLFNNEVNTRDLERTSTLVLSSKYHTYTREFIMSMITSCVTESATCIVEYIGVDPKEAKVYRRLGKGGGNMLVVGVEKDADWTSPAINRFVNELPSVKHVVMMMSSDHYKTVGVPVLDRSDIVQVYVSATCVMHGPVNNKSFVEGTEAAWPIAFSSGDSVDHVVSTTFEMLNQKTLGQDPMFALGLYNNQGGNFKMEAYDRDQVGIDNYSHNNGIYANNFVQDSPFEQNNFLVYYTVLQEWKGGVLRDSKMDFCDIFGTMLSIRGSYLFRDGPTCFIFTPDYWRNRLTLEEFF
ncbi:hypothetical protein AL387_gp208 [Salmon gill poxvirus]|uniref:Uncharacterized protein n=1 Tax=Salmon gill poxvirus TaxID=1680908 RepID=A0A0H4Y143_9POXV|nr:hypothetical protein AL387_gp003 [Salmon gill poxvirus]YP_009162580.1 hypothetical protein AL387_gp208 [Salmon gill poxvirus]AKR04127.1 hypothetical protein SGPV003 [Salmon gill poxvirus]AKR04332.1 hypothetical protein SGPV208 [Salmon gill poxvirus]